MDRRVREVRHGAQFELACHEIEQFLSINDMQRLLRPVVWLIARDAEGFPADADGLRIYRYRRSTLYPSLVFYFSIDSDDNCTLRYVRRADDDDS